MKCYDSGNESKCITYIYANNLYDYAMSQYLLYSEFKCRNVDSVGENSSVGYILEVDLEYPSEFHKMHNDYPLVPEKL